MLLKINRQVCQFIANYFGLINYEEMVEYCNNEVQEKISSTQNQIEKAQDLKNNLSLIALQDIQEDLSVKNIDKIL